ncbi:MAG: hypothetical protein WA118_00375 [Carboxydocellales bacterium]|jgi:hypothetical protein
MLVAEVKDLTREIKLVIGESSARFPHANSLFIDDDVKHIDHIKGNYQFHRAKFYAHELDAPVFVVKISLSP